MYTSIFLVLLTSAIVQENVFQVSAFRTPHGNRYQCNLNRGTSFSLLKRQKCVAIGENNCGLLRMAESGDKDDFWQQQRDLMNEMSDQNEQSLKEENSKNFSKVQNALITETVFFSALLFSLLWLACDNPFVPFSYVFGSVFGIAYTYGLGKYVETVGGTIDDAQAVEGAGVGQARFAFLIMLFLFVGKLRAYGLIEIPSILGFFTYQLASLSQGLKEDTIA